MEKFKNILIRFLKLRAVWTILLLISSAAGLIIIFLKGLEASLIAYIVYVTAFYTLLVVAFSVPNLVRQIKSFVYGNKYGKRYVTDLPFRMRLTLLMSLVANVSYAVLQLGTGIYYASFWYGAVGIYYFVVCIVHFMILRNFQKEGRSQRKDLRVYRFCGYLLFVLTVAAFGMVIQIVRDGKGARYPGLMVYTMAIYAFYRITSAIISVVKHRKLTNPVLTASKFLGLATALMAIFSLQTAMIDEFGGNDSFSQIITPITGGWVCIIILCMAVFIIRKANKSLRALAFNKTET